MFNFSTLTRRLAPVAFGLAMAASAAQAQTSAPAALLTVKTYNADGNSFHVNATPISGRTDAVLLDTGFTRADALRVVAMLGRGLRYLFAAE